MLENKSASRVLGVDYGDRRTGLALSDERRFLAGGIGTVTITGMNNAVSQIAALIAEKEVKKAVIGKDDIIIKTLMAIAARGHIL